MCNLYSITTNQEAIIRLFRVINRYVGNLAPMPGVFPDYPAPVLRNTDTGTEMPPRNSIASMVQMPPQPKRLTPLRADKYENERCGLVRVVSPRVARTVLYSNVSLLEHARLSTVDFKGDFAIKDNIVVHGVGRMHSRGFRFKPFSQARQSFAIFSASSLRVEIRGSHDGIGGKRHDPEPCAPNLCHHGGFVENFMSVPIC